MRRNGLVFMFTVVLFGFILSMPTSSFVSIGAQNLDQRPYSKYELSGFGDNLEDFVDQTSDLHAPADLGTHSTFSDIQDYGVNYDQMQEEDTGGIGGGVLVEDYLDQTSDVDISPDLGSHGAFADLQDTDDTYDLLSEALPTAPPVFQSSAESWSAVGQAGHSFNYTLTTFSGDNRLVVVGVAWEDAEATADVTDITFNSVSIATEQIAEIVADVGFSTYVAGWYILDANLPSKAGSYNITVTVSEAITREIMVFVAEYTGVEQEAPDDTGSHQTPNPGDTTFTVTANEDNALIVAVGCTGGTTSMTSVTGGISNHEDVSDPTVTSEGGAIADYIGATSGDHTVGWTGLATRACSIGGVWSGAASSSDYQMDLEVQFTTVVDFLITEELCIKTGTFSGSEDINVTYWSGSSWTSIASDLTASQWNNFTVSLTSSTFAIKFGGSSTTSDAVLDTWNIDSVLLQVSGAGSKEDVVDVQSDVDGSADVGTHSSFAEMQTADLTYDTLTEIDTAGSLSGTVGYTFPGFTDLNQLEINEIILCQFSLGEDNVNVYSMSAYGRIDAGFGTEVVRYLIYADSAGSPGAYLGPTNQGTWTASASWTTLDMETNLTLSSGDYWLGLWSNDEIRPYYQFGAAGQTAMNVSSSSYPAQPDPFGSVTEWHNREVSVYFSWDKDLPNNYELDLEVQFTDIPYLLPVEKLCIYAGAVDAEDIIVQIRTDGGTWSNVTTDLTGSSWNNHTIKLNTTTLTIRFIDGTPTGDTSQGTWQIDIALMYLEHPGGGAGSISFRAFAAAVGQDTTSVIINKPSGTIQNDVMVCTVLTTGGTGVTFTLTGWTIIQRHDSGTTLAQAQYYKVAGASEPATYTISFSPQVVGAAVGIATYIGVDTTTPIDAYSGQVNAASTSVTAPSITTTSANAMLVGGFGTFVQTTITPATGMTERYDIVGGIGGDDQITDEVADEVKATAGATGTRVATAGLSAVSIGQLIALKPAAPTNYMLDLEVGWTAADFDETNEELCIYPVTGGGWPSEDIKVDVWNGAWTNVIADLTPDQWNNVSISNYLAGITFEIRFLGGTETSDTTQDTWEIDAVLLHTWTLSYAPANDQAPTLDNPSDTDNMYAQYLEYQVTVFVSDQNGFADIDYLEIGLWDNSQTTEYCRFRYDEDTNTFTEEYDGGTYVSLNSGGSSAVESGNDIDATFYFTIDWDFPDATDLDAQCYVIDTQTESTNTWFEVDWDVETRLDYSVTPSIDDGLGTPDRGNLDGSFSLTGTVVYYMSVDDNPSSAIVDVFVSGSEYGTNAGPWNDLTLSSGVFDVTCYADDLVGQDTYTVKVVEEGAGAGGTDLYYSTSVTDTYIADSVQVQSYSVGDDRVNVNDNVNIDVTLYYDYDDTVVTDGAVTINTISATHQGAGVWRITDSEAAVMANTYDIVAYSGGIHGLANVDQNGQSQQVIWDQIVVQTTVADDTRVNINDNVEVRVTLWLAYNSSFLGAGDSVTLDDTPMTWDAANSWFDLTVSQTSVGLWTYFVNASTEATFGITAIDTNSQSVDVIWDRVLVASIAIDETYVDLNEFVQVTVQLEHEYDRSSVLSGTFGINGEAMTHVGSGVWTADVMRSAYQSLSFDDFTECNADAYGITGYNMDGNSATAYWDRIEFYSGQAVDARINVGSDATIIWEVRLETAGISITSDLTAVASGSLPLVFVTDSWRISDSQGNVGSASFSITSASFGGIDAFVQTIADVTVIWDRVIVETTTATPVSVEINQPLEVHVMLAYEYDNTPVTDGLVSLDVEGDSIGMTYSLGNGYWSADVTKSVAGDYSIVVASVSGNSHGITALNVDGKQVVVQFSGTVATPGNPLMLQIAVVGGAGIGLVGTAIVLMRRRSARPAPALGEIDPIAFGVGDPTAAEATPEEAFVEITAVTVTEPEEVGAVVAQKPVVQPEVDTESIVGEVAELDAAEVSPEALEMEEATVVEKLEVTPEEVPTPKEIPSIPRNLARLTKRELFDLLPDDIKSAAPELNKLRKRELLDLVRSLIRPEE
ncbi:MAG: hypothetical protein ACE5H4_03340 [Candidatus Thorarchaeota archaeon]